MVENDCASHKQCETEFKTGYSATVLEIDYDPIPEYDFGTQWPQHHHRRHIMHGVGLPKRLLENSGPDDHYTMLEKLLEWLAYHRVWVPECCARISGYAVIASGRGMIRAIREGSLRAVNLLAFPGSDLRSLSRVRYSYPIFASLIRFAIEREVSVSVNRIRLAQIPPWMVER